jgi:battenin
MLPMPGAPSSSWALFRQRLRQQLDGIDWSVAIAFWLFGTLLPPSPLSSLAHPSYPSLTVYTGLINNILYVILLTAALDLVGPSIPKGTVLLADVIPSFAVKLTAPYYIHSIPYTIRIWIFCALSTAGMLLVGLSASSSKTEVGKSIGVKMAGIVLASLSSGGGELSFVGLTHFYGQTSLAAWGSGTGGAGLVGAGMYALLTTGFGLSVRGTLLASAFLPVVMLVAFFVVLPRGPLRAARKREGAAYAPSTATEPTDHDDHLDHEEETAGLLSQPLNSTTTTKTTTTLKSTYHSLLTNLRRAKSLFWPYMLPLFLVYVAEYTINQGISPVLLFPLPETPFKHYRAFYPTYATLYQLGVFASRSSLPFLRIRTLYIPTWLQVLNLALLAGHAVHPFLPSVWWVFSIVFWEGLLGGLVYVSTFAAIREEVKEKDREFSLGATTVSDSGGICVAGFVSIGVEKALCEWNVGQGRDWCRRL